MNNYKVFILNFKEVLAINIKEFLRNCGYEVVQNLDKTTYMDDIRKEKPHVILINCTQNTEFEIEVCKRLKKEDRTNKIPLIAILDQQSIEARKKYLALGIEDYIDVPFEKEELNLKVQNQMKFVESQRELYLCRMALAENLEMIRKQKNELDRNLNLASRIQEALIPKSLGSIPNCSFNWIYQPSGKVGGDIFDVFMLDKDHLGLYMIDVMGHGLAAAMLAVTLSESLILDIDRDSPLKKKISTPPYYEIVSPIEVVRYLNKRFPFGKYEHYFTIFYMVLNIKTGVMSYVRGGHPIPLLLKESGEMLELDAYGTPVGFEFCEDYEEKTITLSTGDHLIIYTDGLAEIKDGSGNAMGHDGIVNYVKKEGLFNGQLTMGLSKLVWEQSQLSDDLTVLEMSWNRSV